MVRYQCNSKGASPRIGRSLITGEQKWWLPSSLAGELLETNTSCIEKAVSIRSYTKKRGSSYFYDAALACDGELFISIADSSQQNNSFAVHCWDCMASGFTRPRTQGMDAESIQKWTHEAGILLRMLNEWHQQDEQHQVTFYRNGKDVTSSIEEITEERWNRPRGFRTAPPPPASLGKHSAGTAKGTEAAARDERGRSHRRKQDREEKGPEPRDSGHARERRRGRDHERRSEHPAKRSRESASRPEPPTKPVAKKATVAVDPPVAAEVAADEEEEWYGEDEEEEAEEVDDPDRESSSSVVAPPRAASLAAPWRAGTTRKEGVHRKTGQAPSVLRRAKAEEQQLKQVSGPAGKDGKSSTKSGKSLAPAKEVKRSGANKAPAHDFRAAKLKARRDPAPVGAGEKQPKRASRDEPSKKAAAPQGESRRKVVADPVAPKKKGQPPAAKTKPPAKAMAAKSKPKEAVRASRKPVAQAPSASSSSYESEEEEVASRSEDEAASSASRESVASNDI
jgi:hypothetical protein